METANDTFIREYQIFAARQKKMVHFSVDNIKCMQNSVKGLEKNVCI